MFIKFNHPKVSCYMLFSGYPLDWLGEALMGVREQTFDSFEFVFVAYGDNDLEGMLQMLQLVDFPYKFYYKPDITDFISAITFAVSKCQGEYVIRADCDDIMMPNGVKRLYECIEETDASIVIPDHIIMGDTKMYSIARKAEENAWVNHAIVERDKYNYIKYLPGQTFRDGTSLRSAFHKYGFKIEYLDTVCFIYREHTNSITSDPLEVDRWDKLIKEGYGL